jgi:hypothetical protein
MRVASPRGRERVGESLPTLPVALLAGLWILLGILKLAEPTTFDAYIRRIGLILPGEPRTPSWIIPCGEVLVGLVLLLPRPSLRLPALYVSLASSLVALSLTFVADTSTPCGCFGSAIAATRERRIVVASALLFLSAGGVRSDLARRAHTGAGALRPKVTHEP